MSYDSKNNDGYNGERQAPRGRNTRVFVSNLDSSVNSDALRNFFSSAGTIVNVSINVDENGESKGHAVVEFSAPEEALNAVNMKEQPLNGTPVRVKFDREFRSQRRVDRPKSVAENQVFIGNLSFQATSQDLKDLGEQYGTVVNAEVINGRNGRSRGIGVISYASSDEAKSCIDQINGIEFQGRVIVAHVDQYAKREQAPVENGQSGAQLFVSNLAYRTTWQDLKDHFGSCGEILRADVAVDHATNKSKGFGTVRFRNAEDAQRAISELNGQDLHGRPITVRLDNKA